VSSTAIEVVRGRLEPSAADELLAFWAAHGVLSGEQARRRLREVVCLLRRGTAIAGVSSAYAADVALLGGRRFWVYRSFLPGDAPAWGPAMIAATFDALEGEFDLEAGSPIGLCLLLSKAERQLRPDADWYRPPIVYAGYLEDGRQVRAGYFDLASASRQRADA
jgi:hypothetical protein